jgi:aspartyl-tRNA(Asn)/glutamyl-tRNA(Gln) amidotransferase subunit A
LNDTDLAFSSIEDIARMFRKRKLSPVELTKLLLTRIAQLNPKLNAFITVTEELALRQAKKAESELFGPRGRKGHRDRGPLHGIPVSLKDNIYTANVRTTAGSQILRDLVPEYNAPLVANLFEAGAVLIGKANLHEFAYGVTTNNPHFGPARNPWDAARIPGGSSGGSGVALAAGLCYGSIGTDTGGSIRVPASLCGIVGLKTSFGAVSVDGIVPLSPRMDVAGPMARSAQDAALLLEPLLVRGASETKRRNKRKPPSKKPKFTLGIPKEFFLDIVSDDVRAAYEESLRSFRARDVKTKPVSLPLGAKTEDAGNQIAWPEATHFHQQSGWFPARAAEYGEDVRSRLEMGTKITATVYLEALELRNRFIQQLHLTLASQGIDALAVPATTIAAPLIGEETTRIGGKDYVTRALLLRQNRPANLAGVPAISVPCGFTPAGLPVGLQLIGGAADDDLLLAIAQEFEREHPQTRRPAL